MSDPRSERSTAASRAVAFGSPRVQHHSRDAASELAPLLLPTNAATRSKDRPTARACLHGEPVVRCPPEAIARRRTSTSRGSTCASSGPCCRAATRDTTAECVANHSPMPAAGVIQMSPKGSSGGPGRGRSKRLCGACKARRCMAPWPRRRAPRSENRVGTPAGAECTGCSFQVARWRPRRPRPEALE
jgi:hypothetical protein